MVYLYKEVILYNLLMNEYKKIISFLFVGFLIIGGFASLAPKAYAVAINAATKTDVTPGTQSTAFVGVPVYRLHVTNSGDALDTITSLSLTPSGAVVDTNITLHFYNDVNNNGIVDQGDVDLLGTDLAYPGSIHFHSDNTKNVFTLASPLAIPVGVTHILITADGGPAVGNAQTFLLSFALGADVHMGTVQITPDPGNMPNSYNLTISNTAPSLAITKGENDPIAKTATASQTGVVVKQLTFTAQATSDSIVSLAITPNGNEDDAANIASTKFYIDLGTPGLIDGNGADILLSTTPTKYSTNNGIETFTFLSPFLIPGGTPGTPVNILYTYNLGAGVVGGKTLTAQLVATTDAVAGSGITVSSNSSGISSTITIASTPPTLAQPTVVSASTVKANSANKVIGAFSVTETGGISDHINQFTIENKSALTAVAADIGSVAIYSDSGVLGVIDGGDAVACAESTTNTTTNFDAGDSVITFTCSSPIAIGASATQNYLAAITTTSGATNVRTMAAKVNAHLVTASAWAASDLSTTNSITIDTIAPTTLTTSPVAGTYIGTQSITLSSVGSDIIRFTIDGSIPSCSEGTSFSVPISVSSSKTINVISCDNAGNSTSAPFAYTINIISNGGGPLVTAPAYIPPTIIKTPSVTLIITSMAPTSTLNPNTNTNASMATIPVSYNFGSFALRQGNKGNSVLDLQKFLNEKMKASLKLDGKFGKLTIALVKQWQKNHALVVDGIVGVKTKRAMNTEAGGN